MTVKKIKRNRTSNKRAQNRRKKETYWTKQINAYRASNLSATRWCEENNINVHTLTSWITKLNLQQNKSSDPEPVSELPSDQMSSPDNSSDKNDNDTEPSLEIKLAQDTSPSSTSVETPEAKIKLETSDDKSPVESTTDSSESKPTVVIRHGAITITAEKNYAKATLMALLDVLLRHDANETTLKHE